MSDESYDIASADHVLPLSEKQRSFLADLLSHDDDVLGSLVGADGEHEEVDEVAASLRLMLEPKPDDETIHRASVTIAAAKAALAAWEKAKGIYDESSLEDCIADLFHLAQAIHVQGGREEDTNAAITLEARAWNNFWAERNGDDAPPFPYKWVTL